VPVNKRRSASADFCAGFHHRYHQGKVEAVAFESFEDIENRFETDWTA